MDAVHAVLNWLSSPAIMIPITVAIIVFLFWTNRRHKP
jgi:hypothetical protein